MQVQFVKPAVIPFGAAPAEEDQALKMVELCGRTAYKSEDRITSDSAKSFVLTLKKLGHLSVLEHSNIALEISGPTRRPGAPHSGPGTLFWQDLMVVLRERNGFHRLVPLLDPPTDDCVVSGNFRSWIDTLTWLQDRHPDYWGFFSHYLHQFFPKLFPADVSSPANLDYRVTLLAEQQQVAMLRDNTACDIPLFIFKFVCDRGLTHEVVRHRVFSFTQESTRYVNYQNRGMTLILPEELQPFYDSARDELLETSPEVTTWLTRARTLFDWYQSDLARGLKPEIARDILPNLLKSEIFVSGRWSGWQHFIQLRDSKKAHPRIREIAREVRRYFESIGMHVEAQEE